MKWKTFCFYAVFEFPKSLDNPFKTAFKIQTRTCQILFCGILTPASISEITAAPNVNHIA